MKTSLQFDNAFVRELPGDAESGARLRQVHGALYSPVSPTRVAAPHLLAYAFETAHALGLSDADVQSAQFAQVFSGNALLPGMQPFAANYGGHQFGNWAGQLGDGRAITLGEAIGVGGQRLELQLKGAGPTPYSRSADGRAVLRSSVREFLCSEAMQHLGVPTTRALSLIATGETVVRDMFYDGHPKPERGAVVCRVAPSFIRFGNFELPASRNDAALLQQLVDFTIARDFPELSGTPAQRQADWFAQVCERTARVVAEWMRVGFVHGVMNTDNMSILGLTIDYGPYGWIDNYDPDWTPNTTDREHRRYRFGQQPQVAYWNLTRLASALALVLDHDALRAGLQNYATVFAQYDRKTIACKLGLAECRDADIELMQSLHALMAASDVDMTLFFRALADVDPAAPALDMLHPAFYDQARFSAMQSNFLDWLRRYATRLQDDSLDEANRKARMQAANPKYVLRNYLAQQAIDLAEQGDPSEISNLLELLRHPYDEQPDKVRYAVRRPDWARDRAGCSMLSCSS